MTILMTLCDCCKNYIGHDKVNDTYQCTAFPDKIPPVIGGSGDFLHFEKYPSQKNDIVFEFDNVHWSQETKELAKSLKAAYDERGNKRYYEKLRSGELLPKLMPLP